MRAAIFAANPNLIYLQTTALNEPLSLALLVWATAFFTDFAHFALHGEDEEAARHLKWSGWLLMCDMLVRYDGWFYGAAFVAGGGRRWPWWPRALGCAATCWAIWAARWPPSS